MAADAVPDLNLETGDDFLLETSDRLNLELDPIFRKEIHLRPDRAVYIGAQLRARQVSDQRRTYMYPAMLR